MAHEIRTTRLFSGVACSLLLLLAACDRGGKSEVIGSVTSEDTTEMLMSINGRQVITISDFETFYNQTLEQQPQIAQFAAFMPDFKSNLYDTLSSYKLLEHWVDTNNINRKADYQQDRAMLLENIERSLALKYFQLQHPVEVSDADTKKYYDDNKETVYLMAPSGIAATGVKFESEKEAKDFLDQAKKADDIAKAASDIQMTSNNFGRVNEQSKNLPEELKKQILGMSSFPSTQLFEASGTYWVVQAKSKDQAKYYSFEQAQEDARSRLTSERSNEVLVEELGKLKATYKVVENKSYFEIKDNVEDSLNGFMQNELEGETFEQENVEDIKTLVDGLPAQQA